MLRENLLTLSSKKIVKINKIDKFYNISSYNTKLNKKNKNLNIHRFLNLNQKYK